MRIIMIELALFCGCLAGFCAAGEQQVALSSTQEAGITTAARENVSAILNRRPPKEIPALASLQQSASGISISIFNKGKLLAAGESLENTLLTNIRLAAGKAVYNAPLNDIDQCAIFVAVLGEGKQARRTLAPLHPMLPGQEAYLAQYKGGRGFMGPLEPLAHGWDWKTTLLELVRRTLPPEKNTVKPSMLLQISADPDFVFTVYPATVLVSPSRAEPSLQLMPGMVSVPAADAAVIRQSLLEAFAWYKANQAPDGSLPFELLPTPEPATAVAGATSSDAPAAAEEDLAVTAYTAFALGELWHTLNLPQARLCGLAVLDGLLRNHYLDSPDGNYGYIKEKQGVPLGTSALALLAIRNLKAADDSTEVARCAEKLSAFCLSLRAASGIFSPWLQPKDETEGKDIFPPMAISALLSWNAEGNAAAMLASAERYRQQYTSVAGAQPPGYAIYWLTGAAVRTYGITRKNSFADWALRMNTALAGDWLNKHRIHSNEDYSSADAALTLSSLCEALYLQKLLLSQSGAEGVARLGLFRRGAQNAARTVLALQVRGGVVPLLLAEPKKYMGAYRRSPGSLSCSLRDISFSTAALCRALSILEQEDYTSAR